MNSYERLNFTNGQPPQLNDVNLNHIDKGIADAFENTEENKASIRDLTTKNEQNTTDIVTIKANEKTFEKSIDLGTVTSLQTLINYKSTGTIYTGTIAFSAEFTGSFVMWIVQTKRFLLCSDGTLWVFDNPTTTTATKVTYSVDDVNTLLNLKLSNVAGAVTTENIADGNITLTKLAQAVVDLINSKANTHDVYLVDEADEHFVPKTNENGGGVVTDYIADKAVTLTKLNDDVTNLLNSKADSDSVISNADNVISNAKLMSNSVSTEKIVDGAVTLAKLGIDANAKINSKYDSANIENGTSVLTPHSSSADKVKENSCIYEKIGNMCFYNVTVILNAFTMVTSSIHLIDLPFSNVGTYPNYIIATSNKGALFKAVVTKNSTWLTITTLTGSSYTVTQDEQITFNFCVKIA